VRALAAALLVCSTAYAEPELLRDLERAPTAGEVRQLGPDADRVLIAAARDPAVSRLVRLRAVSALTFAPTVRARAFLLDLLAAAAAAREGADVLDVAAALGALAAHGPSTLPVLLPYLAHASADVRQSAAYAIAASGATQGRASLTARLRVEREPGVQVALRRAGDTLSRLIR
jgi:hypothetical protein